MSKRFTSTELWAEDWFLEMPVSYKLFWYYMLSKCNHAGLFKVNLRSFCSLNDVELELNKVLDYFNNGKDRIRVINETTWLIEDFFSYQYGSTFNIKNRVHDSVKNEYDKLDIKLTSIRGLKDLKHGVKDKDIDIDKKYLKEKEVGVLEIGKNENENIDSKIEDMIVREMMNVWKKKNTRYPEDIEKDYQSLLELAYKIGKVKNFTKNEVVFEKKQEILDSWTKVANFAVASNWFRTKPLSVINSQWQTIYQEMLQEKQNKAQKEAKPERIIIT